jgi:hypothetical protein
MLSFCIVTDLQVAVSNTKLLSISMETQERITFAHLSSRKIICSVVNNKNVFRASCKIRDTVVRF